MELPDEMTPAIADALGMMNFQTGPIAHAFRVGGVKIPHKCEIEQAFVLFWALKLAIEHGDRWRDVGHAELEALRDRVGGTGGTLAQEAEVR